MIFLSSFGRISFEISKIMAKSNKRPSRPQSKSSKKASAKPAPQAKRASAAPSPLDKFKPALTHIGIIVGFAAMLFVYFSPLTSGKVIKQHDITQFNGQAREVRDFYKETGDHTTWTNVQFSGMPAYHMGTKYPGNLMMDVKGMSFLGLPQPVKFVFLIFVGFYILLLSFNMGNWMSALGAFCFAFSSYFFIILEAGHTSKAAALAYMAPTIAGVLWAYRGKLLLGGVVTALGLSLNLAANHFQITMYMAIMILLLGLAFFADAIVKKTLPAFAKASGVLILAALLGTGPGVSLLWTSQEYAKDTTRGPKELKSETAGQEIDGNDGLDIEYALRWSYGQAETFTLLIPNFHGGSSSNYFSKDHELAKKYQRTRLPTYWGDQPGTSGPVYVGAIICFLFILGLIVVEGPLMWWLLAATILSILLSWGRNLQGFTELFFYNVPMYNKFRAVSMTLVIAEFCMPFLGFLALHRVFNREKFNLSDKRVTLAVLIAGGFTGLICLFWWAVGPEYFPFTGVNDQGMQPQVIEDLKNLRKDMFTNDALRSLGLVVVSAGLLWAYLKKYLKMPVVLGILVALSVLDLWTVNKRFLNDESFVEKRQVAKPLPSPADRQILQDKDPYYRVFNITGVDAQNPRSWQGPYNESRTSYFHFSVGGYHAAKLRRYQDMIDKHIMLEMAQTADAFSRNTSDSVKGQTLASNRALNMLNTKYIINNPNQPPIRNPYNLGNAWFVSSLRKVNGPDAEIAAVGEINPANEAVIDTDKFGSFVEGFTPSADPGASIELTSYAPNKLEYQATTSQEMLAVFSDVYYNGGTKGWNMYINGEKQPHFRVNYILRSARIPAGTSKIEFRMEPRSYQTGEMIALISSIILILAALGIIFLEVKNNNDSTKRKPE